MTRSGKAETTDASVERRLQTLGRSAVVRLMHDHPFATLITPICHETAHADATGRPVAAVATEPVSAYHANTSVRDRWGTT